jgi:Trp operon repressor
MRAKRRASSFEQIFQDDDIRSILVVALTEEEKRAVLDRYNAYIVAYNDAVADSQRSVADV